jgi:hypothetical protein
MKVGQRTLGFASSGQVFRHTDSLRDVTRMSLYANIPVTNAQAEAAASKATSKANPKSAALYAGVLAQPARQPQIQRNDFEEVSPPVDLDPDKPAEASGTFRFLQLT